jgi:hypothetical protein
MKKLNKKGLFTAFGAFLLILLTGFAWGAHKAFQAWRW